MKRIIKAGFMMLLGAAIWTNGGDVKHVSAEPGGDGICKAGWLVTYEGDFTYCVLPDGSCRYHPSGVLPAGAQTQQRPTNTRPVPPKPSSYGAVAWGSNALGSSTNQTTKQNAIDVALQKCGQSDCEIATWYGNQCVAMSYGIQANNKYLWKTAVGTSTKVAEKNALLNCKKGGAKSCKVHFSECSLP